MFADLYISLKNQTYTPKISILCLTNIVPVSIIKYMHNLLQTISTILIFYTNFCFIDFAKFPQLAARKQVKNNTIIF